MTKSRSRTKKCYEEVFDSFTDFANKTFNNTPETRSLVLLVDWEAGQTDFPFGAFHIRKDVNQLEALLNSMKQAQKMLSHQADLVKKMILSLEEAKKSLLPKSTKEAIND